MIWQDILLAVCGIGFSIALLPTLINKKTQIPISSSLTTASLLSAMSVAFFSLELWLTFFANCATATIWYLLVIFRRVKNANAK